MTANWFSRYWPALVVLAVNLWLCMVTSPTPGHPLWVFYAGLTFRFIVVAGMFFICWRTSHRRERLHKYLQAVRKGMAGYAGVD